MSPPSCQGGDPANLQPDYRQGVEKLEPENVGLIKNYQPRSKHGKENQTVQFQKEKDTKNTVKFEEVQVQGEAPIIGSLYVQKWFIGDATNLKVTVEVG